MCLHLTIFRTLIFRCGNSLQERRQTTSGRLTSKPAIDWTGEVPMSPDIACRFIRLSVPVKPGLPPPVLNITATVCTHPPDGEGQPSDRGSIRSLPQVLCVQVFPDAAC